MGDWNNESKLLAGERNSFRLMMLVLSAHVIKADGHLLKTQVLCTTRNMAFSFGREAEAWSRKRLEKLFLRHRAIGDRAWSAQVRAVCQTMESYTSREQRLLVMDFLTDIALADSPVKAPSVQALQEVAEWLRVAHDYAAPAVPEEPVPENAPAPSSANTEVEA